MWFMRFKHVFNEIQTNCLEGFPVWCQEDYLIEVLPIGGKRMLQVRQLMLTECSNEEITCQRR